MPYPKLSIITPSFNQGAYLESTIKSVLDQGYPNLEYIIIDGGSTDNSVEIIKKYESHLTYWVSEKDDGQTDAVNKGIKQSSGELLGWINSDDLYTPGTFKRVVKTFEHHPDCIVVHGDRILIDGDGDTVGWTVLSSFDPQKHGFTVCSETAFWRRKAMDQVGPLKTNLRFAMDLEFFCRLYGQGKFVKLDQYLGCFRCHADNKSSTIAHVGREEAEREWKALFGNTNENWKVTPDVSKFRLGTALIKHPFLIGLPYIQHRFKTKK